MIQNRIRVCGRGRLLSARNGFAVSDQGIQVWCGQGLWFELRCPLKAHVLETWLSGDRLWGSDCILRALTELMDDSPDEFMILKTSGVCLRWNRSLKGCPRHWEASLLCHMLLLPWCSQRSSRIEAVKHELIAQAKSNILTFWGRLVFSCGIPFLLHFASPFSLSSSWLGGFLYCTLSLRSHQITCPLPCHPSSANKIICHSTCESQHRHFAQSQRQHFISRVFAILIETFLQ